ncbi:hypothetical protein A3Q56_01071 [Intoshia linei]|uniref:Uncharacterized protein n=1 Tax=Intoshia linei TaxID=1819745 RepID=A0A177BC08_9BILA|nr:hypothetical protein A3Q56_01071 [Intoshia linei]
MTSNKDINFVANAKIWTDHCTKENNSVETWKENWSFLVDLEKEDDEQRKLKERENELSEIKFQHSIDKVNVPTEPSKLPKTSAGMIGWRSTEKDCLIDILTNVAAPRGNLVKQLKWPEEAID